MTFWVRAGVVQRNGKRSWIKYGGIIWNQLVISANCDVDGVHLFDLQIQVCHNITP